MVTHLHKFLYCDFDSIVKDTLQEMEVQKCENKVPREGILIQTKNLGDLHCIKACGASIYPVPM